MKTLSAMMDTGPGDEVIDHAAARDRALTYEPRLVRAVSALLRAEMRLGAKRVRSLDTLHLVESEVFPHEPDTRRLLLILEAVAEAVATPIIEAAPDRGVVSDAAIARALGKPVTAAADPPPGEALGISFSASNPIVRRLLDEFGLQVTQVTDGERRRIVEAARTAYFEGLSVLDAAKAILSESVVETTARAQVIARTMLVGAANGASLAAVRMVGGAQTKSWLAADDARVRPDHADASGQTVPVDQPFQIGGYAMQYPGDPSGPPDEVVNCRCTLIYDAEGLAAGGGIISRMAVSGSASLPLSERDHAWDAGAARKRLSPSQYADAHFWRDPEGDPETLAAYKLPFADVVNGRLTAIWRGVTAGAQRLSQTQLPSGDVAGVKARMATYYRKAAKQYGDDTIQPPWASGAALLPPNHDYAGTGGPCVLCGMPMDDAIHFTAAVVAATGPRWTAVLALEGIATDDDRIFDVGAFDWREPPLTLYVQFENADGHEEAVVGGRIDAITRVQQGAAAQIIATGVFTGDDVGTRAAELVADRFLRGVSVDFCVNEAELVEPALTNPFDPAESAPDSEPAMRVSSATILAVTVLGMPAFDGTTISLAASAGHSRMLVPLHATLTYRDTVSADVEAAAAALDRATLPERITAAAGLIDRHVITEAEARRMIGLDGDAPDVPAPIAPPDDAVAALAASLDGRFQPLAAALERVANQPPPQLPPITITLPEQRPVRVVRDPKTREIVGTEPVEVTS